MNKYKINYILDSSIVCKNMLTDNNTDDAENFFINDILNRFNMNIDNLYDILYNKKVIYDYNIWNNLNFYDFKQINDLKKVLIFDIYNNNNNNININFNKFDNDIKSYIIKNTCILNDNKCILYNIKDCIDNNHLYCLMYLIEIKKNQLYYNNKTYIIKKCNNIDIIKYVYNLEEEQLLLYKKYNFPLLKDNTCFKNNITIDNNIKKYNFDIIKYLIEDKQIKATTDSILLSILYNHINITKYLINNDNKLLYDNIIYDAIVYNRIDLIKYLYELGKINYDNKIINELLLNKEETDIINILKIFNYNELEIKNVVNENKRKQLITNLIINYLLNNDVMINIINFQKESQQIKSCIDSELYGCGSRDRTEIKHITFSKLSKIDSCDYLFINKTSYDLHNIILFKLIHNKYLLINNTRNTFMLMSNFNVYNYCSTCDGTTIGSFTLYEEKELEKLFNIHLTINETNELKLNNLKINLFS